MSDIVAKVLRASCQRFIGHLGKDPEIRYLESGKVVAKTRLGVSRGRDQETDWFTVEVWGDEAQVFTDKCRKGNKLDVVGRVKSNKWQTHEGEERTDLIVTAEMWRLIEAPQPQPAAAVPAAAPAPAPAAAAPSDDPPF